MRSSNQLGITNGCDKNIKSSISGTSRGQDLAYAQKSVALRLLKGENIPSVAGEIDSILVEKKYVWENLEQRIENLTAFEERINDFVRYYRGKNLYFPDASECVVNYFGEEIVAKPDFLVIHGDSSSAVKISTGAFRKGLDYGDLQELYALGLCAEKLFPDLNPEVDVVYLKETPNCKTVESRTQRYDFDRAFKHAAEKEHISLEEAKTTCSPAQCLLCPQKNICGYEEPPIAEAPENSVRDINTIRLSSSQRAVVNFERGVARCNAGPGGGKTLVVALRIAELLKKGAKAEDFCVLTYTKAGAEEMTARAMDYAAAKGVPLDAEKFMSGTINSFCQKIIDDNYEALGYTEPPKPIPEEAKRKFINELINEFPRLLYDGIKYDSRSDGFNKYVRSKQNALEAIGEFIETVKQKQMTRSEVLECQDVYPLFLLSARDREVVYEMYEAFEKKLFKAKYIEFDDQLRLVNKLFEMDPELFRKLGYKHIIVDEFQDTDYPQIELLNKIIDTPSFKSFLAVGDDSQSIFGFRHTSPEYMINFGNYFGQFTDFALTENHRSTKRIVSMANSIIDRALNKVDKELVAANPNDGANPIVHGYYTKKQEMDAIAADIKKRWDKGERSIAVLMSQRSELKEMASALTKIGVPSVLMCRIPYVENSRVAALQTFFDSFMGRGTQGFADYKNVVLKGGVRGMSANEVDSVVEEMESSVKSEDRSVSAFKKFANALDESKTDACYQDFLERFKRMESMEELEEFWANFKIYGDKSEFKREGKYAGVNLNTIHSSKGLEWDTTYLSVTKLDSALLHRRSFSSDQRRVESRSSDMDEALRKFFVGATRARENLIVTGNYLVKADNGGVFNQFLKLAYEIQEKPFGFNRAELYEVTRREKEELREQAKEAIANSKSNGYSKSESFPSHKKEGAPFVKKEERGE